MPIHLRRSVRSRMARVWHRANQSVSANKSKPGAKAIVSNRSDCNIVSPCLPQHPVGARMVTLSASVTGVNRPEVLPISLAKNPGTIGKGPPKADFWLVGASRASRALGPGTEVWWPSTDPNTDRPLRVNSVGLVPFETFPVRPRKPTWEQTSVDFAFVPILLQNDFAHPSP